VDRENYLRQTAGQRREVGTGGDIHGAIKKGRWWTKDLWGSDGHSRAATAAHQNMKVRAERVGGKRSGLARREFSSIGGEEQSGNEGTRKGDDAKGNINRKKGRNCSGGGEHRDHDVGTCTKGVAQQSGEAGWKWPRLRKTGMTHRGKRGLKGDVCP